MTRIFASSRADVTGSSVEPEAGGAFEGRTWGSDGIVGSAGGPSDRSGGGTGKGSGGGGSGGNTRPPNANGPGPPASIIVVATSINATVCLVFVGRRKGLFGFIASPFSPARGRSTFSVDAKDTAAGKCPPVVRNRNRARE